MTALPTSDRPTIAARLAPVMDWLRAQTPAGANLTSDTRKLKTGDVFVAYVLGNARQRGDGRPHIPQAIQAGASAVLAEAHGYAMPADAPVRILPVDALAELAGPLAARWYAVPGPEALRVIGVTGTNEIKVNHLEDHRVIAPHQRAYNKVGCGQLMGPTLDCLGN